MNAESNNPQIGFVFLFNLLGLKKKKKKNLFHFYGGCFTFTVIVKLTSSERAPWMPRAKTLIFSFPRKSPLLNLHLLSVEIQVAEVVKAEWMEGWTEDLWKGERKAGEKRWGMMFFSHNYATQIFHLCVCVDVLQLVLKPAIHSQGIIGFCCILRRIYRHFPQHPFCTHSHKLSPPLHASFQK